MDEQKVRNAFKIASELAGQVPSECWSAAFHAVFNAIVYPPINYSSESEHAATPTLE